jgi:hypothetical protein
MTVPLPTNPYIVLGLGNDNDHRIEDCLGPYRDEATAKAVVAAKQDDPANRAPDGSYRLMYHAIPLDVARSQGGTVKVYCVDDIPGR